MYRNEIEIGNCDQFPYGLDEGCGSGCRGTGMADESPDAGQGAGRPTHWTDEEIEAANAEQAAGEQPDMKTLKSLIQSAAARVEAETGGTCTVEASCSSDDRGPGGYIVFLTVQGHSGYGYAAALDGAVMQAKLKVSILIAEAKRSAAATAVIGAAKGAA